MAHTTCGAFLRRTLDAETNTVANLTKIASLEMVLGRPQSGIDAGRFKYVDYECEACDGVDLRPFWSPGSLGEGDNRYDWDGHVCNGLEWTLSRPDVCVLSQLTCVRLILCVYLQVPKILRHSRRGTTVFCKSRRYQPP
jgi:hypothetical protein